MQAEKFLHKETQLFVYVTKIEISKLKSVN